LNDPFAVMFTPRASREVDEAKRWWRENRTKAPNALEEELRHAIDLIAASPAIGAIATNINLDGVRRVFLNRVKYFVYYRSRPEACVVEIVALWHARRGARIRL
jgi:plasmid stabilization system protein ParE